MIVGRDREEALVEQPMVGFSSAMLFLEFIKEYKSSRVAKLLRSPVPALSKEACQTVFPAVLIGHNLSKYDWYWAICSLILSSIAGR